MLNLCGKTVIFSGFYDESLRTTLEQQGAVFSESVHVKNDGYLVTRDHLDLIEN